jgi:signal transduction histidine kinase
VTAWRAGHRTTAWWIAAALGVAILALDLAGRLDRGAADGSTALFLVALTTGMVAGLWVWAWRPATHMGPLMFWWAAIWLASDLPVGYPDSRLVSTIGLALFTVGAIVFAQMALSYPTGRLESRLAWIYVAILGYAAQVIQNVVNLLFYDARLCEPCAPREPSYLFVGPPSFSLEDWNKAWTYEIIAVLPIGMFILWRKYLRATGGARRSLGPVVVGATVVTCTSWITLVQYLRGDPEALTSWSNVQNTGILAVALASFFGLALTRRARGSVGDLVVELDRAGPGGARRALAKAIGDPTLELALWLPERGAWVDEQGDDVVLPDGRERAVTFVGDRLAAIVHDPIFLDQPAMLEAAGSAAHLALENARLQAELRLQLAELRESRARIVRAGDEERRRLERDLHDGAQQRLLGVGMALQLLRSSVAGDDRASALVDETEVEVQGALRELRELARGIHPAVLTDQGLGSAIRTLAERTPVPVEVIEGGERLPAHVETAAYFVVAEALANVAKYAHASRARVTVERTNGRVVVEVRDDGVGGADAHDGSGLRGLADRVGAIDGTLLVESPPGGGTRLVAEIPCAS